jgi:hypothetical protein
MEVGAEDAVDNRQKCGKDTPDLETHGMPPAREDVPDVENQENRNQPYDEADPGLRPDEHAVLLSVQAKRNTLSEYERG